MKKFIPVNEPLLGGNEKLYLNHCIDSGWISSEGPFVEQFETTVAEFCKRKHGVAVTNGSAALDIAVDILDIGPGDEVIIPTFTIISCAAAVVRAGAKPVLVDIDPNTWNMDINQIEDKITKNTKAIMIVHIYNFPVDVDPIIELANVYGLKVIEDAAEMLGQTYKEDRCGGFGDVSTFSFYPNKHVTTGEGGMVLCDDDSLAQRARAKRNLCFQPRQRFLHEALGWNMRMTNLQAAVGVAQMEKLQFHLKLKRRIGAIYNEALNACDAVSYLPEECCHSKNIYWVFGVLLNPDVHAHAYEVTSELGRLGVGTRPFFIGMHEQPVFHKMGLFINEEYPVASQMARRGFYLPSGLGTAEEDFRTAASALLNVIDNLA